MNEVAEGFRMSEELGLLKTWTDGVCLYWRQATPEEWDQRMLKTVTEVGMMLPMVRKALDLAIDQTLMVMPDYDRDIVRAALQVAMIEKAAELAKPRDLIVARVDERGVAYNAAGESIGITGTMGPS